MSDGAGEARVAEIATGDGVRLALHRLGRPGAPPALLVPGTFSNHTFWTGTRGTGFARTLAAAGFEAWCLDPRGHGRSQRPAPGDRWNFEDWAREDLPAALRAAAAHGPVLLIGHSAGGAAALACLGAEPALRRAVRAAVVAATPLPWLQAFRLGISRFARATSRLLGRFPARAFRLGPEDELAGVMTQWMTWNIEGHWTGEDGTDYAACLAELELPMLFLAGTGDRIEAPPIACHALFKAVGSADKTFLLCGRDTGFSEDFDHAGLLVSRAAREEVWPKIIAWIEATVG